MKGSTLRRRQRHIANQADPGENNAPVNVIFRAHADSLSKAPFLYCPRNFNLPMPASQEAFTEEVIELIMPVGIHDKNYTHINNHIVLSGNSTSSSAMGSGGCGEQRYAVNSVAVPSSTPSNSVVNLPSDALKHTSPLPFFAGNASQVAPLTSLSSESPDAECGGEVWICRAYCFGEKDAVHANGAISVHQSVANKSQYINGIAKGKATARVIPTYAEVRERFGLSHVELAFENLALTRADMFLVSEALRDHILYEGQEISICGVTVKVNEQLRYTAPASSSSNGGRGGGAGSGAVAMAPAAAHAGDHAAALSKAALSSLESGGAAGPPDMRLAATLTQQHQMSDVAEGRRRLTHVRCGLVTAETLVNFRSLSAKYFIILEISKEMWNPTMDGRVVLNWAIKKFLKDYLVQQVSRHKASPLVRIAFIARLEPQYAIKGEVDILHMMIIPPEFRLADVPDEVNLQCEVFLQRVLCEVRSELKSRNPCIEANALADALTEQDIFVHAKNTGTMEALSLMLDQCAQTPLDSTTGYVMSIVTAGKGLYQVKSDLLQATCTQLFNVGIEKVNIVCIGRPPLHETPLLEYLSEDETLRSQYHLRVHSRNQRIYERPEWARSLFYHPPPDVPVGGALVFELLTKDEWTKRHRATKAGTSLFDQGLGLQAAPLPRVLLPVPEPFKVGPAFSSFMKETLTPAGESPAPYIFTPFCPFITSPTESTTLPHSALFSRSSDMICGSLNRTGRRDPLCIFPMWYSRYSTGTKPLAGMSDAMREYATMRRSRPEGCEMCSRVSQAVSNEPSVIVACGVDVLDSDVQGGYMLLELQLSAAVPPDACWSPALLRDEFSWTQLMSAFVGRDSRLPVEEQGYFMPHFRANEIFCRRCSAITGKGRTLILKSHPNSVSFAAPEEVVFTCRNVFFTAKWGTAVPEIHTAASNPTGTLAVPLDDSFNAPLSAEIQKSAGLDVTSSETCAATQRFDHSIYEEWVGGLSNIKTTVAHIQIRSSVFFAIQPIGSYLESSGTEIVDSATPNVSSRVLFRRRWLFAHPDAPSSVWSALCHCKILPLYGTKSAYPRDSFYAVPPHQYAVPVQGKTHLLEYILQRLRQQYQIVVDGQSIADVQWPRCDPAPNVRVELSIEHQIHKIKVSETGQSISVSRMMHCGMYSNTSATHIITHSCLLLNYLTDGFTSRKVRFPVQIGEKEAFHWEALDTYLRERPDALIPRSPSCLLQESEICVVLLPESVDAPPVPFSEFIKFIGYRFSVHLTTRGRVEWSDDCSPLSVSIPDEMVSLDPSPLCHVVLSHDNPLTFEQQCLLDHQTGRTLCLFAPAQNRVTMSVDIALPGEFNPRCHYFLSVSWIVCVSTIVSDWFGSFLANAARYHFRAIPMPSYQFTTMNEKIAPFYTVCADSLEEEPQFRRRLLVLLTNRVYGYFPDTAMMNRNCRLVHISGLCYVTSQIDNVTVARWYENPMLRVSQPEHQRLLQEFIEAVQRARGELGEEEQTIGESS